MGLSLFHGFLPLSRCPTPSPRPCPFRRHLVEEATGDVRYLDRAEVLAETFASTLAAKGGGFVWEHYTVDFEIDWES